MSDTSVAPGTPQPGTGAAGITPAAAETPLTIGSTARLVEPAMLVYAAAAALAWVLDLTLLPWALGGYAVMVALASVAGSRGRLTIGPDTITARYLMRTRTFAWPEVWAMYVQDGLFQRYVIIRRANGRRWALPALRAPRFTRATAFRAGVAALDRWSTSRRPAGPPVLRSTRPRWPYLLGLFLLLFGAASYDRPWYWLAFGELTSTPGPCTILAQGPATGFGLSGPGGPEKRMIADGTTTVCSWTTPTRQVSLGLRILPRQGVMSGTGVADGILHDERVDANITHQPVSDLDVGDGGHIITWLGHPYVAVRQANVIVTVEYLGPTADDSLTAATEIARHAVGALRSP